MAEIRYGGQGGQSPGAGGGGGAGISGGQGGAGGAGGHVTRVTDEIRHQYMSTACLHGLCDQCRNVCKFCKARCRHVCHIAWTPAQETAWAKEWTDDPDGRG
jgi:hypothetical protein